MLKRSSVLKGYEMAAALLVALTLSWYALNQARVHYYNDAMEGQRDRSPYFKIIQVQDVLVWPIAGLCAALLLSGIYEVSRSIAKRISN
jgi:hypothetical protein